MQKKNAHLLPPPPLELTKDTHTPPPHRTHGIKNKIKVFKYNCIL